MIPDKEQFGGSLIGQCLGDALGFIVEGQSPAICKQYVTDILNTGRAAENGRYPFPFGQYSDDSQLARELLQSYIDCNKFDPCDYADRIAAIFMENRIVGCGRATEEAALKLSKGVSWQEAGTPPPSAGNGSAMRAGPIGLLFFDDPQLLIQSACNQGRITHQDKRCSAGAVAIAGAVSLAVQNKTVNVSLFLHQLSEWTRKVEDSVSSAILKLNEWVLLSSDKAIDFISRAGLELGYADIFEGISPFVTGSVLWSLYAFLKTSNNYWETICTAIAVGGDVDTTAAMAGAISGAHLGISSIPSDLARHLTDQGEWGFNELVRLTEKCYELKTQRLKS